jgi:hypothetical protein
VVKSFAVMAFFGSVLTAFAAQPATSDKSKDEQSVVAAEAAEAKANDELKALRARRARGEAVTAEVSAVTHEKALKAQAAASRARFRAAAETHKSDPEARLLRRELLAATTSEERRAVLAKHAAVERALDQESAR